MTPRKSALQGPELAAGDSFTPCASCADKDDIIEGLKRVNGQLAQALHDGSLRGRMDKRWRDARLKKTTPSG